jgi:Sel1 repeat
VNKNLAFDLLETHSVDADGVEDAFSRRMRNLRAHLVSGKITEIELCAHVEALDQARHYLISQAVPSHPSKNPSGPKRAFSPPSEVLPPAGSSLPIELPPSRVRHFHRILMLLAPLLILGTGLSYFSLKNQFSASPVSATSRPKLQPPSTETAPETPTVEARPELPQTTSEPHAIATLPTPSPSKGPPAPTADQALSFTFAYMLGTQNGRPISLQPYCTERLGTWYGEHNISRAEAEQGISDYYRRWPYQQTHWVENECEARQEDTHFAVTIPFAWTASDGQRTKTGNSVLHATLEFSNRAFLISSAWNVPVPPVAETAPTPSGSALKPTENGFSNNNFMVDISASPPPAEISSSAGLVAETEFNRGRALSKGGTGSAKDLAMAANSFRHAADLGYAPAQQQLAVAYAKGWGVPPSDREAVFWYRKAANQGFAEAQHDLGVRCIQGKGTPKNVAVGIEWYRKSAAQGWQESIQDLRDRGLYP